MREDFQQEDGHSSDLDPKRSRYSTNESKPQGEMDRVAELMMIKFSESGHPDFRATSPLSRGTVVEIYQYTSAPMGERLKLFFAQLFLFISSVFTEQSQICVMNTGLVKQERKDPYCQSNLTHCLCQQVR